MSPSPTFEVIDYNEHDSTIVTLFGSLHLLDTLYLSVSFVIIMIFIMGIEWIFHRLHQLTEDTAFYGMITSIEKELMIVGFMAFLLKVIVNAQDKISHDWFSAVEFADLVIPITSMIYLAIGLLLMYIQTIQTKLWFKAYNLSLVEIFDEYLSSLESSYGSIFFGNKALEQMEFRILHHIFCDEYKIKENACPFDKYAEMCYEKSVLTISPSNWCIIIFWVLLNLLRQKCKIEIYECDDHSSNYEECFKHRSLIMFSFFGGLLLFIACILGGLSRLYVVRMLRGKGINTKSEYITFLQLMEAVGNITSSTSNNDSDDQQKITANELKEALIYAKNMKNENKKDKPNRKYFTDGAKKKPIADLSARSRRTVMLFDASKPQESIASYFLFSKPQWYFNIIDGLIMPIAFYGSLWVCNFCLWSYQSAHSSISAALLRLVTELDSDTLKEAIENTETSTEISNNLRSKILSRLNEIGEDVEFELKLLFKQIDEDGSDLLSRSEFQEFLGTMKIAFSRKKWSAIFAEIDKNYDNEIAFQELFIFLFPNNDKALAVERKRLQNLRKNVRERLLLQQKQQGESSDSSRNFPSLTLRGKAVKENLSQSSIIRSAFQNEGEFETAMLGNSIIDTSHAFNVEVPTENGDVVGTKPVHQLESREKESDNKVIPC